MFFIIIISNAVKRLIAINHIQNKFCLHNKLCVYCVDLLCIYKDHTCMNIIKKMLYLYIKYIYI